jgi:hypothetical protein
MILTSCIKLGPKAVRESANSLGLLTRFFSGSPEKMPSREKFHKEILQVNWQLIIAVRNSSDIKTRSEANEPDGPEQSVDILRRLANVSRRKLN